MIGFLEYVVIKLRRVEFCFGSVGICLFWGDKVIFRYSVVVVGGALVFFWVFRGWWLRE